MKVHHQLRNFHQILAAYDGNIPLHRFLVNYYKQHKQMGSSDRRWASRYVYAYYRLAKALMDEPIEKRLAIADFLVNDTRSMVVSEFLPHLVEKQGLDLEKKLALVVAEFPKFKLEELFPYISFLSSSLNRAEFLRSLLVQPDLFIRVKESEQQALIQTLKSADIASKAIGANTIALANGTKLEQYLPERSYYVQDLASQRTAEYFKPYPFEYWWDCCAASGGKSLLLHELEPSVKLLVSDVRESTLLNLKERFKYAGINTYQQKVLDLRYSPKAELHAFSFDGILLDAPCTGSGTWGRTPEMLSLFDAGKINSFVKLQRDIALNVVPFLKTGKPLIYMTCSVFEAENEGNVAYFKANLPLELESMELIDTYNEKGDTLFVARFIKL